MISHIQTGQLILPAEKGAFRMLSWSHGGKKKKKPYQYYEAYLIYGASPIFDL